MNRRQLFKLTGRVALGTLLASVLPSQPVVSQPVVMGMDVATEGADTTFVSLHGMNASAPDDLGGYLVPQEYVDEILQAMKADSTFRSTSRTVSWWPEPSTDTNLLVDNFKRVHRDFAQFLKKEAA